MKQGLSLRVSQHLALTPQLQQSIRLLQLSTLELNQEVEQLLDENPFLERADDSVEREAHGLERTDTPVARDDADYDYSSSASSSEGPDESAAVTSLESEGSWEGDGSVDMSPDDSEWGGDAPARNGAREDDEADATELARSQESLQDFLKRQALSLRLSAEDSAALQFLIESLNEDGYLEDPVEELARSLTGDDPEHEEAMIAHFGLALRLLQSLEPTGVGARNMAECLRLQLHALQADAMRGAAALPEPAVVAQALRMIEQPPELLARRDLRKLAQLCGGSEALTREALGLVARLEPKPGRRFVNVERNVIVPDVLVLRSGSGAQTRFRVQLNPDIMPRLRVHDIYANALKGHKAGGREGDNYAALQQRLQEARWFIKNIQQRFDTILRVSSAIVERQKNFFVHGELAMRPLVLREIADELGLHESTISRVTTAKYMSTPFGTYELKYFFGSGLGTESGGNASSTAVRALIKQFVSAENAKKPLSDSQLSEMLKEQGIECARRTVAKYREALKIAPANLRKAL
ncbi:RNA polymerase factor sigma-54 [Curvibacter sp. PAE-UM]|uniref:RNA polymerase factor sigma-54 n=1 Tax=Curvibacter sp. PAE-UM TaxID=1714344 RepID=UPI00070BEA7C|nr:RNA polymerase factor sigma-54 [Curvibacter sp. PAE-UM]KRH98781.1 RNA polymerase sigma-54 factor [Curvibacter sp. PAE-UM]